jgi:hypothetical protein
MDALAHGYATYVRRLRGGDDAAAARDHQGGGVSAYVPSLETAARSLKVVLITAPVHSDVEIESAITALGREPGGGLVVMADAFMAVHRVPMISASARKNRPVDAGELETRMSTKKIAVASVSAA